MSFLKTLDSNDSIKLYKYRGEDLLTKNDISGFEKKDFINVCFVDLETTGLDYNSDVIIEIGIKTISFNKNNFKEFYVSRAYESYNDTDKPLDPEVVQLTGITKDMICDKKIDWSIVEEILDFSDVAVAHNAEFDRYFLSKNIDFNVSWSCSKADVDWKKRGFLNTKLELLSIWHGFFYESHRAMNDVNATIHLLAHPSYDRYPPIEELVEQSSKSHYQIINKFPYNPKLVNVIKKRRKYKYNPSDKTWRGLFRSKASIDLELEWLKKNIYNGYFTGDIVEISPENKYKL